MLFRSGGLAVLFLARWDGSSWSALGSGLYGAVNALEAHEGDGLPALYVGGAFTSAIDSSDSFVALWGCEDQPPVLSCPSAVNVIERVANGPGESVSFTVTATDDLDPAPVVVCVPPSGSAFPLGTTLVNCTATDAAGNQSTCQFPVTVQLKVGQRGL